MPPAANAKPTGRTAGTLARQMEDLQDALTRAQAGDKDAVADLLRKGLNLAMDTEPDALAPVVTTDKKTGLPLIECKQAASSPEELTPERVAEILLAQELEWHHAAGR